MGRPPLGKQAMSTAERQRRYWERVLGGAPLKRELDEVKSELARAKAELAQKGSKPPDEMRERRIKALTTELRNLKLKLEVMVRTQMDSKTRHALAKALDPGQTSAANRAEAYRQFNLFISAQRKGRW